MTEPVRKEEDEMSYKPLLALFAPAIVMLVGCNQPAGLPDNVVHAATTQTAYCYVSDDPYPTGHIDWDQGQFPIWDDYVWDYQDPTIKRAFDYYQNPTQPPTYDTMRAHPRKNGFCRFAIPGFNWTGDLPACTLFYYQSAHNGSPALLVNAWVPDNWPPGDSNYQAYFWRIWNSTDTVATDSTHTNDGSWYKVPLSYWARCAIADSGSEYYGTENYADFYTGWIYPSYSPSHGVNGWYTGVSGSSGYEPYIKVVYNN
jgi:hypothetical protein